MSIPTWEHFLPRIPLSIDYKVPGLNSLPEAIYLPVKGSEVTSGLIVK